MTVPRQQDMIHTHNDMLVRDTASVEEKILSIINSRESKSYIRYQPPVIFHFYHISIIDYQPRS